MYIEKNLYINKSTQTLSYKLLFLLIYYNNEICFSKFRRKYRILINNKIIKYDKYNVLIRIGILDYFCISIHWKIVLYMLIILIIIVVWWTIKNY